jgi:hypothetical protein
MAELFVNDASTTLASSIGAGDTTLTVAAGTGFPSSGTFRIRIDNEIMTVTAVSGVTWTVTRSSETVAGITVAATHSSGAAIASVLTAGAIATISGGGGSGTVTNVSIVTANGVSGSVSNPNSTPAITLTLGAITPSSVAASGSVTGSNLSGTNTGDQTITLTGDVTGSGTGSFAATIGANKVTYAKIQQTSAGSVLLGNPTGSAANPSEITLGAGLSFSGSTLTAPGGSGTVTTVSVVTAAGISGSVANPTTTPAITITIGSGAITNAQLAGSIAASKLVGTDIVTVGTITSGVWNGTRLTSSFVPTDVAYLDVAQIFTAVQTFAPGARSSGVASAFTITGPADTNTTASTERICSLFDNSATVQFATGALTTQRSNVFKAPTYGFVGSSTLTTAVTLEVEGSPVAGTNATIVQPIAARFKTGQAGGKALVLTAASPQTNNIFEAQTSGGSPITVLNNNGRLGIGSAADDTYGILVQSGVAHERIRMTGSSSSGFYMTNAGNTDGATVRYDSTGGYRHFVSNVLECMQFTITNAKCGLGQAVLSIAGAPTAQLHVWANSSSDVVCKVQGASGQSVDLQEWLNNGSTVLSSVLSTGDITTQSAGVGFRVKEGSNAKMGTGTLSGGTVVISTTAVHTNSRVFLQDTTSGSLANVGSLVVSSISDGTSFTVKSSNVLDTSTFNWIIFDPA